MAGDSTRPLPALPPGAERPQWHHRPPAPGELRRIPDLVRDSLSLIGRRWRAFGEYVLIAAAGYIVALVMLFLGLNALFGGQFFAKLDELSDPLGDSYVGFGAWLESFEVTPTATAFVLIVAFGLTTLAGFFVQDIAITRMALDDVHRREINFGKTLAASVRRMPKVMVLAIVAAVAVCGPCILGVYLPFSLFLLWALPMLVIAPLLGIYFVMAYVEARIPSPRRWWRLMRERKAAIWGRVALMGLILFAVEMAAAFSLGALPLPALYGDLITNVMVIPLTFVVTAVVHSLIYADLTAEKQQPASESESLS